MSSDFHHYTRPGDREAFVHRRAEPDISDLEDGGSGSGGVDTSGG